MRNPRPHGRGFFRALLLGRCTFWPDFVGPSRSRRSRCPRGAKPIFFFSAEKKKTVLDAKRKRERGKFRGTCPFLFVGPGWGTLHQGCRHWAA